MELGIGPICRSNYGDPQVPTSETMLKKALGLLAVADLPQDVVKDILKHKTDARTVCNMLVYYASYHYDNKTEVLKVTGIIRELGYENLATKLETDRTNISITVEESGDFVVRTPHDWGYLREARKVAGSQRLRGKLGGKVVRFPAATQKEMMTILGIFFQGEEASNDQGRFYVAGSTWDELRKLRGEAPPQKSNNGSGIRVVPWGNDRVAAFTPYNANFIAAVKGLRGRKWESKDRCWSVPKGLIDDLKGLVSQHYGVSL